MSILLIKKFLLSSGLLSGGLWVGMEMIDKEREFQFTLKDSEKIGIKEQSSGEFKSGSWQIMKREWQGMGEEDWKGMRKGRNQYIYKTFVKGGGTMKTTSGGDEKKVKNLLGLGKFEWANGKTTMKEEKGVCAVIGKDSTGLLVMMVKSVESGKQKELWMGSENGNTNEGSGCEKIFTNKEKFEKGIEVVRKGFISGIGSTVLKEENVKYFEQQMKPFYDAVFQVVVNMNNQSNAPENKGIQVGEKIAWMEYGSVGIISGVQDVVVLDIIKFEEKVANEKKEWTRHRPFDIKKISMSDIIFVNLEELVISEESIGDGNNNEIKWGNIPKPTLVSKLLK